jgi:hypothetical protein
MGYADFRDPFPGPAQLPRNPCPGVVLEGECGCWFWLILNVPQIVDYFVYQSWALNCADI